MQILGAEIQVSLPKGIILWDLDGTLLHKAMPSSKSAHADALGLKEFSKSNHELTGLSDWDVLTVIASENGLDSNAITTAFDKLDSEDSLTAHQKFVLNPGVTPGLLENLGSNWIHAVLTGNCEKRATIKLLDTGILDFFDKKLIFCCKPRESRSDIAIRAKKELLEKLKKSVIIGDTPHDIRVAMEIGVPVLSVASGSYTYEDLLKLNPLGTIKNMELNHKDLNKVLENLLINQN